ncbi:hypothetical protein CXU22_02845 [Akkermansia muciniphila]|uniref:Uncharacterized protein n=1 Tax=Akkermansia muciniphila TaxID=239935 RepID=A0A2N8HG11_9BACT|nr:hypothetical protein CXU22_02845 [Akkermansia muciniphila]
MFFWFIIDIVGNYLQRRLEPIIELLKGFDWNKLKLFKFIPTVLTLMWNVSIRLQFTSDEENTL